MSNRRVEAFLLRLVVDEHCPASAGWRGRIQHVASGSECQFDQVQEALAFIDRLVQRHAAELAVEAVPPSDTGSR